MEAIEKAQFRFVCNFSGMMEWLGWMPCWANRRPSLFAGDVRRLPDRQHKHPASAYAKATADRSGTGEDAYTPRLTTIHTKQVILSFIPVLLAAGLQTNRNCDHESQMRPNELDKGFRSGVKYTRWLIRRELGKR
jgi:hypothetical protein